jgi:hypothetical protein
LGLVLFGGHALREAEWGRPEGVALEGCLTISSEERETWTAVSLRDVSGCKAGDVRRDH